MGQPSLHIHCRLDFSNGTEHGNTQRIIQPDHAFNIPNAVAAHATFAADPALAALGPYANNNPDMDQYCTWCIMYMPHWYINLFLNQGLPPFQAWEVMTAAMTADNTEVDCALLLDWIQAECTQSIVNGVAMEASPLA